MTVINSNRAVRGPVTAIPLVAGKGVRLVADTENNRWVVEADETVLFEDPNGTGVNSGDISEAYTNFERLLIEVGYGAQTANLEDGYMWVMCSPRSPYTWVQYTFGSGGGNQYYATAKIHWTSSTHFDVTNGSSILHSESSTSVSGNTSFNANVKKCVLRIIGINRVSAP